MKFQSIYNRLRRIEGQIRAVEEMIANDKNNDEIFIQLSAAKSALSSTLISFVDTLLKPEKSGEKILSQKEIDLILRLIK